MYFCIYAKIRTGIQFQAVSLTLEILNKLLIDDDFIGTSQPKGANFKIQLPIDYWVPVPINSWKNNCWAI